MFRSILPNFARAAAILDKKLRKSSQKSIRQSSQDETAEIKALQSRSFSLVVRSLQPHDGEHTLDTYAYTVKVRSVLLRKQNNRTK